MEYFQIICSLFLCRDFVLRSDDVIATYTYISLRLLLEFLLIDYVSKF
jgi:hypothetical protein